MDLGPLEQRDVDEPGAADGACEFVARPVDPTTLLVTQPRESVDGPLGGPEQRLALAPVLIQHVRHLLDEEIEVGLDVEGVRAQRVLRRVEVVLGENRANAIRVDLVGGVGVAAIADEERASELLIHVDGQLALHPLPDVDGRDVELIVTVQLGLDDDRRR